MSAEHAARQNINDLLQKAGWHVCDVAAADLHAARGVAIRELPLSTGFGFADYLLYVDGQAAGAIEAKKEGATLTGVEIQSGRYAQGLPASRPAWRRALPFIYESTGVETHFTNGLDPQPRAHPTFAFHQPTMLAEWLARDSADHHTGHRRGRDSEPDGVRALHIGTDIKPLEFVMFTRAVKSPADFEGRKAAAYA